MNSNDRYISLENEGGVSCLCPLTNASDFFKARRAIRADEYVGRDVAGRCAGQISIVGCRTS